MKRLSIFSEITPVRPNDMAVYLAHTLPPKAILPNDVLVWPRALAALASLCPPESRPELDSS